MEGQDAGNPPDSGVRSGDPAMAVVVPTEQYRDNYLFHAPTNYSASYVNITAPLGAKVLLPPWLLIGASIITMTMAMLSGLYALRSLRHIEPVTLLR